jgi:hypothetical protein
MWGKGLALLLALALAGCTRIVDDARPLAQSPVAPISAAQVDDLLSKNVERRNDDDANLFTKVQPEKCAGISREVDPPFIFDAAPAAHDGGRYFAEYSRTVSVVELVGVYRADFDPKAAIARVKRSIESCRNDTMAVTTMRAEVLDFRLLPQADSGSPDIVLWSLNANTWACDNAYVAAHNAAIELTTCGDVNGYDVLTLAKDALKRIETLVNTVA